MSEITPNTPNPVREDEYYEALAAKLGIPASAIPRTPVWRNEEELAALVQLFTNMQGSSGGGVLVVNISKKTDSKYVCDKTTGEMWSALTNGNGLLFYFYHDETFTEIDTLRYAGIDDGEYGFIVDTGGSSKTFISDSLDAYPETTS